MPLPSQYQLGSRTLNDTSHELHRGAISKQLCKRVPRRPGISRRVSSHGSSFCLCLPVGLLASVHRLPASRLERRFQRVQLRWWVCSLSFLSFASPSGRLLGCLVPCFVLIYPLVCRNPSDVHDSPLALSFVIRRTI